MMNQVVGRPMLRQMCYGTLTALVVLAFVAGVVLLQGLFRAFVGQESTLSIMVATLLSAALLNPLRRRLQAALKRRARAVDLTPKHS